MPGLKQSCHAAMPDTATPPPLARQVPAQSQNPSPDQDCRQTKQSPQPNFPYRQTLAGTAA